MRPGWKKSDLFHLVRTVYEEQCDGIDSLAYYFTASQLRSRRPPEAGVTSRANRHNAEPFGLISYITVILLIHRDPIPLYRKAARLFLSSCSTVATGTYKSFGFIHLSHTSN
jgi:hypothetical protein